MVSLDIDMVLIAINAALSENVIPDQKFYKNLTDFRDAVLFNLDSKVCVFVYCLPVFII